MYQVILYFIFITLELITVIGFTIYMAMMFYSAIMGSPYVPTKNKMLKRILDEAGLKKGQHFMDLGCGDGRIVRFAAYHYNAQATGVDINPVLIWFARLKSHLQHVRNTTFNVDNIYKTDVSKEDVIYIFLMPQFLKKLHPKLKKETKKGAIIISHGFRIMEWEQYLYKTLADKPFPTYYYRLSLD